MFYDIGLTYPEEDNPRELLREAKELGYKGIGFSSLGYPLPFKALIKACNKIGLDYVKRLDISSHNKVVIKEALRKYRREVEVIVVHPLSVEAARLAARDSRVDVLNFHLKPELFEPVEAKMMALNGKVLEVNLRELISNGATLRLIHLYRRMIYLAQSFKVEILISSGASKPIELRRPRDLASILLFLGFKGDFRRTLSEVPFRIVSTNRAKLSKRFVARGVWLADEGKI